MPSVRVRRNTATVATLVPAEPLRNQSTSSGGSTGENTASRQGQVMEEEMADKTKDLNKEEDMVVLAPPVSVTANPAEMKGDSVYQPTSQSAGPSEPSPVTSSPQTTPRKASASTAQPSPRRRARSRTIQAIFPASDELLPESMKHSERDVIHEEPEHMSPMRGSRTGGEPRLSSEERTHRAEVLARARGESISSTSGAAPISIRIPPRDRAQLEEAVGSPISLGTDESSGRRRRSASISLGLARRSNELSRTSGDRPRSATHHFALGDKPPISDLAAGPARARSRTVGGPLPNGGRNRSDSVGLISYFGLGSNGVEAKMQSWEDNRRDLEKGGDREGKEMSKNRVLTTTEEADEDVHHDDEVVEHLDVIDPEISAVSHLQNFANSVMIPYFPELYSRKPTLDLPSSRPPTVYEGRTGAAPTSGLRLRKPTVSGQPLQPPPPMDQTPFKTEESSAKPADDASTATDSSEEDALDQHVKNVLKKSKKEWLKRSLKGVWAFLKTPMGIITGIYGFMVVFWGAALVLFLLGWIPTSSDNTKDIWVERCSQIENGLFTVTGVGFIPWRVMDMYRIFRIWQLKRKSVKLRKKRGLPPIEDPDDLPDPKLDPDFVPVLSEYEQALLEYQQERFMASQTWYRPHATETHRAFSINWALYICAFIIGNSVFQCMLCGCMWGLNRHQRPAWTTGSLIPLSFGCGIASGILIWKGGQRTKKTAEVEKKLRKALGMDSQEGWIDEAEKTSSSAPRKADTRSSVDSYNNGEAGSGSSGSPEDRDSQRLLPVPTHTATECEVPEGQRDTQAEIGGEEYEMMEKQSIARRKDGL